MYCLEKKILSLWPVIAVFIFMVATSEISKSVHDVVSIIWGAEILTECVCTGIVINSSGELWGLSGIDA